MKKVLLGTTALVCALSLASAAHAGGEPSKKGGKQGAESKKAEAAGLNVKLGGSYVFEAAWKNQDDIDTPSSGHAATRSRDLVFANDTRVNVSAEGTADNGLKYGAVIELLADTSGPNDGLGGDAERTYLFVEGGFGRIEAGSNYGADQALKVNGASVATGSGGIDGNWRRYVNLTGADSSTTVAFVTTPNLPTIENGQNSVSGVLQNANKVSYFTPRFSGFQAGVSYTPDQGDRGTAASLSSELGAQYEGVISGGVNYTGQFDQVGVKVAAVGESGDRESGSAEDLSAYEIGAQVSSRGFSVAGSWADWNSSGQSSSATEASYWSAGVGYETGPLGLSLTYLSSEVDGASTADFELTNYVVGVDYKLAPGLTPYLEVAFFDADDVANGSTNDNSGTVAILGTAVNF